MQQELDDTAWLTDAGGEQQWLKSAAANAACEEGPTLSCEMKLSMLGSGPQQMGASRVRRASGRRTLQAGKQMRGEVKGRTRIARTQARSPCRVSKRRCAPPHQSGSSRSINSTSSCCSSSTRVHLLHVRGRGAQCLSGLEAERALEPHQHAVVTPAKQAHIPHPTGKGPSPCHGSPVDRSNASTSICNSHDAAATAPQNAVHMRKAYGLAWLAATSTQWH